MDWRADRRRGGLHLRVGVVGRLARGRGRPRRKAQQAAGTDTVDRPLQPRDLVEDLRPHLDDELGFTVLVPLHRDRLDHLLGHPVRVERPGDVPQVVHVEGVEGQVGVLVEGQVGERGGVLVLPVQLQHPLADRRGDGEVVDLLDAQHAPAVAVTQLDPPVGPAHRQRGEPRTLHVPRQVEHVDDVRVGLPCGRVAGRQGDPDRRTNRVLLVAGQDEAVAGQHPPVGPHLGEHLEHVEQRVVVEPERDVLDRVPRDDRGRVVEVAEGEGPVVVDERVLLTGQPDDRPNRVRQVVGRVLQAAHVGGVERVGVVGVVRLRPLGRGAPDDVALGAVVAQRGDQAARVATCRAVVLGVGHVPREGEEPGGGLELVDLLLAEVGARLHLLAVDPQVPGVVARPLQHLLPGADEEDVLEQAAAREGVDRQVVVGEREAAALGPHEERGAVGPSGWLAGVERRPPALTGEGCRPRPVPVVQQRVRLA